MYYESECCERKVNIMKKVVYVVTFSIYEDHHYYPTIDKKCYTDNKKAEERLEELRTSETAQFEFIKPVWADENTTVEDCTAFFCEDTLDIQSMEVEE